MEFFIYLLLAVILFFFIINYLRKLHWDAIHHNLIELVESIGGKVIRKGILSRPFYHGEFEGTAITINFSTERTKKGRVNYIDISLNKSLKKSFTISSLSWLRERQEESIVEFEPLILEGKEEYGIKRSKGQQIIMKNKQEKFNQCISSLDPFNFIYFGKTGILFERKCDNLAISTKHPMLKDLLDSLVSLTGII